MDTKGRKHRRQSVRMSREGRHLLPLAVRADRDREMVRLHDLDYPCKVLALAFHLSYEGARRILRKEGRMGRRGCYDKTRTT